MQIAVVAPKHLVPAIARDHHLGVSRHLLTDDPGRQAGGITEGLVVLLDDPLEEFRGAFASDNPAFVMFTAIARRHRPGMDRLVIASLVEAHIKGFKTGDKVLAEQRHEHR